MACGRIASRSYEVISQRSAPLAAKTLKWLYQKSTIMLVELPFAVHGARHLGHGEFGHDSLRRANVRVVEHRIAEATLTLASPFAFPGLRYPGSCCCYRSQNSEDPSRRPARMSVCMACAAALLCSFPVFLDGNAFAPRSDLRLREFFKQLGG